MYFPVCEASAVGQEVNRGSVSATDQPLSLNTPETICFNLLLFCNSVLMQCFCNT